MEGSKHPSDGGNISSHQDSGDAAVSTVNLYATLGLSPEDVDALAQIPESEISVETLPFLIMQLKAKRAQEEEMQRPASPKRDSKKEHTDARDNHKEVSPTFVQPRRSNSHGDTDYRKVVSYKRDERPGRMDGRKDSRHTRPSRDKMPDGCPRFPLSYHLDDYHGVTPKEFPHICSLCICMSNSKTTWLSHLNGVRHADGKRELLRLYPEWERRESTNKMSHERPVKDDSSPPRRGPRPSMPFKRPHSSDRLSGEVWPIQRKHHLQPMLGTKVVVIKFRLGVVGVDDLMTLAKPFGIVVKHLVFPCKVFLEFKTHRAAASMVKHFSEKPTYVKNQKLTMYLSPTVCIIHTPRLGEPEKRPPKRATNAVVCFSRLPPGEEQKSEILDLAKMFGNVRHSKFLSDQALIEMEDRKDADIMVKYYYSNPLRINGKGVKVSLSSSHKRIRESPESTTSRREDSSKSHSCKHKNEETGNTSVNKESSTAVADKLPVEKVVKEEESHQSPLVDHKEEDIASENLELEEEEGIMVEDEQSLLDDVDTETGANVDIDKTEDFKSASPVADDKEKKELENFEPSADTCLVDPEQMASKDPGLCDPDVEDMMEQESFHEDDEDIDDMDFPENMEDFVTLDELDDLGKDESLGSNETQGGKVVIVKPIRRGYGLEETLFKLAEPFGKVVNHIISFYRQEARLELESSEKAHEMVNALRDNRKSQVFGKHVSVYMCREVKELEMPSGRSIYIGMLPFQKYSEVSLLRFAEPFGKITGYNLNRRHRKCHIQMETVEAAEKILYMYKYKPLRFYGSTLRICHCRKGDSLIPWKQPVKYELWLAQKKAHHEDQGGDVTSVQSDKTSSAHKSTLGEDGPLSECEVLCGDPEGDQDGAATVVPELDNKQEEPLAPYQPNNPVGLDYLVQRTGFFCTLCNIFCTSEKTAKSVHCSSEAHYQKLKRKMEGDKPPSTDSED